MFTLNLVYQATVVGLSPLQLVLVGTLLEAVCFVAEVPTGVVADLYSRRLSVIIGFALVGLGITLEASVPVFLAVLGSQVLWGVGATFLSGAIEAWITDEVGADRVAALFVRGTQVGLIGQLLGIAGAGALGLVWLRLPIFVGAAGLLVLAGTLALVMPERHFRPDRGDLTTFGQLLAQLRAGLSLARARPLVRTLMLVSLVGGLSSEAFDRLWTPRLLEDFRFPQLLGSSQPAVWFAGITFIGALLALLVSALVNRVSPATLTQHSPARLLAGLAGVQVVAVAGFALAGYFWLALAMLWLRQIASVISGPVNSAWMNRQLEPNVRATVLSMESQVNAIGQVVGGPVLGGVGSAVSIRAALIGSAAVSAPIVALYARVRSGKRAD